MHNYYTYLYNQTVFEVLEEKRGQGEAVRLRALRHRRRPAVPGALGRRCTATFESMAETPARRAVARACRGSASGATTSAASSTPPPADLYKRWCAFGLLSSHSRLHGSSSYRVPWLFDEEAVDVLRFFTKLKCRLMPYLFAAAGQAHAAGVPMMRAMLLEFPDDPACDYLDRQYMLGDALLVAPMFSADGVVEYYLPAGRWTHFLTGAGDRGRALAAREARLPEPAAAGAAEHGARRSARTSERPDYDYADGVTLHVFELEDGATARAQVPAPAGAAGATFEVRRAGQLVHVHAHGATKPWRGAAARRRSRSRRLRAAAYKRRRWARY